MRIPSALDRYWQQFLAKRHPSESGKIRLRHQRLYIVPTVYGLGFAMVAIIMLVGAINYQLSLGFFFAFLLIGIAHAILLRTYANLLGLEVSSGPAVSVYAGENAYFPITLHNERSQARFGIILSSKGEPEQFCAQVSGQDHAIITLGIASHQRGKLKLPRLQVASTMPLGLFRCWTYVDLANEVLIYPQPELNPPPFPELGQLSDGKKKRTQGNDDFAGLRNFQRGDAMHDIAWKQSARTDNILVKLQQSPVGSTLWLNFDELTGLSLEAKLSRLTAWLLQAEAISRPYGLALPQQKIPPALGHDHLHRCLMALALF
ncbi:DUF58 domain-containing protein [Chitinibacter bivalviorum]|uniref:DUF58 domain-containing protein n=1 Tax=Chitinibacter bivalviorum TaxID=2739434 RepID=A0A7H9BG57_9NEIS|nr:DUF58 domain-containing protein [Chitinibacter bivalviorum]QLG87412.1 DUF58 domain-containing protein [Chitinibacter bivalviorum]